MNGKRRRSREGPGAADTPAVVSAFEYDFARKAAATGIDLEWNVAPGESLRGSVTPEQWTTLSPAARKLVIEFVRLYFDRMVAGHNTSSYTTIPPASETADASQHARMRDDLNTAVKKTKTETLVRGKSRPSTHQLATYRALVQHVDLLNPELSEDERKRRAKRLVQAYERVRERRRNFHDHSKQLLAAFSIMNKVKYQRRKARNAEAAVIEAAKLAASRILHGNLYG